MAQPPPPPPPPPPPLVVPQARAVGVKDLESKMCPPDGLYPSGNARNASATLVYVTVLHAPPPTGANAVAVFTGLSVNCPTGTWLVPLYSSSESVIWTIGELHATEALAVMVLNEVTTGTDTVIQQTIDDGRPQVAGAIWVVGDVRAGTAHGSMSCGLTPADRWAVTVIVWLTGAAAVAACAGAAPAAEVTSTPPEAIMATAAAARARLNRGTATRPFPDTGSCLGQVARSCRKSRTQISPPSS